MRGSAEAVWCEDQKGTGSQLVFLLKTENIFGKFFLSVDISPNYQWAMGQHKMKLLEPARRA